MPLPIEFGLSLGTVEVLGDLNDSIQIPPELYRLK